MVGKALRVMMSSMKSDWIQVNLVVVETTALYSAFIEDLAIERCFLEL